MALYENTNAAPMGSVVTFRIINLLDNAVQAFRNWRSSTATGDVLSKLSDAQLRDIGIERGTINDVSRNLASGRY